MVAKGSLGKYTPAKPSWPMYIAMVVALAVYSLGAGYYAGMQPAGVWRYFSWHPFLMTVGMVGMAGIGAVSKKMGGYFYTKLHAILAWTSVFCSIGGAYVIYNNKNINGYQHLKSTHAWVGLAVLINCLGLGMVGSIVLHPDFGLDKTNKTIRMAHKTGARLVLMLGWLTAFLGLFQLTTDMLTLSLYGIPLLVFIPLVLL